MTRRRFWWSRLVLAALLATAVAAQTDAGVAPLSRAFRFVHAGAIAGPKGGEVGDDLAVAPDGSVFVAGYHSGLDLDNDGVVYVPAYGRADPVIVKLKPGGESAEWISTAAGPGYDAATGVAPDGQGGAWVVGGFSTALRFDPTIKISSRGKSDGFLAHYDPSGKPLSAIAVGGGGIDGLSDVGVDGADNVVIVGRVRGAVDIDRNGSNDAEGSADGSFLMASFDRQGALRWAKTAANQGNSNAQRLTVGAGGEIFVTGAYHGSGLDLDGDGRPDLPAKAEGQQGFLARYDAAGHLAWARAPGGTLFGHLAFAPNGDLLVLGAVGRSTDLDGDGHADVTVKTAGQHLFLARYTPAGDLRWARGFAAGIPVFVAAGGAHIALGGLYKGPLDLDGDGSIDARADPDGNAEGMLAILLDDGRLEEVWGVVGISYDQVRAVGFSPDAATIYTTGFVQRTADFDGDGVEEGNIKCDSYGDLFVARYDCSLEIEVALEDEATGKPLSAGDATAVLISGDYKPPVHAEGTRFLARLDRPGSYEITVTKPGYRRWVRGGVVVGRTDCADSPVRVVASLEVPGT
jgi:hypothetical protein